MHALPSPIAAGRILPMTARALPVRRALFTSFTSCVAPTTLYSRRSYTSTSTRHDQNILEVKKTYEKSYLGPGAEGPHIKDLAPKVLIPATPTTTAEEVRGDWVLFHPVYTPEELRSVEVLFRESKTFSDRVAHAFVKLARWGFDLVSGYKHKPLPPNAASMSLEDLRKGGYLMDETQWLRRILFLESIAAVPGMVAAALRHLRSLRLMKRDQGWIHTLLEEAENERMHLMTFMTLKNPTRFFRAMVLAAQGVFYNAFFLCYMVSPSTCHRFVGHLEEEAVVTYTRCIQEIEAGRLPAWRDLPAPEIAKDYWRLEPNAKFVDVMYAVRSDESTHRFVNHSLASLKYQSDINPFALEEPDMAVKGSRICFEREESAKFAEDAHKQMTDRRGEA